MELLRADGSFDERLEQRLHNLITREFHVEHRLRVVYTLTAHRRAMSVSVACGRRNMVNERTLERAVQYVFLRLHEGVGALVLQSAYGAGTHIHHLLIVVRDFFLADATVDMLALLLREKS